AHGGHGRDEGLEQCSQIPGLAPGVSSAVPPIRPDMHARQYDLRVVLRQRPCLLHQLRNPPRPVGPPRDGRRAKGAVLVAAVLDLEEPAGSGAGLGALGSGSGAQRPSPESRAPNPCHPRSSQHRSRLRSPNDRPDARERRYRARVAGRGAAHHDRLAALPPARQTAHDAPQLRLDPVRHGARVHHREVRHRGVVHHGRPLIGERLSHHGRVVLVRLAAEGMEVDVHGRTVRPTSAVHTRSVSPPPRRCSRSTPTSSSARPWANARPDPAAAANSVGAIVPGPNGSWPPRTPNRKGMRPPPISAPADQLQVSNAPAPARAQPRHATDPPNRTLGLGENSIPPTAMRGRSVSALVVSATVARNRLSARAQPITLSPGATPSSRLPDTPMPE